MDAIGMLDIRANGKHCSHCKADFGGLAWQCRYRKQSVAVKGVFNTRVPKWKLHYKLFWSPHLWSCFMWIFTGSRLTPTCSECFGLLWPLHEAHHSIYDSGSDCQSCCYISVAKIHLNLWSTGQAPEWLRSHLWEQHDQWAVWAHGHLEGENFTIPPPDQQTGGVS